MTACECCGDRDRTVQARRPGSDWLYLCVECAEEIHERGVSCADPGPTITPDRTAADDRREP